MFVVLTTVALVVVGALLATWIAASVAMNRQLTDLDARCAALDLAIDNALPIPIPISTPLPAQAGLWTEDDDRRLWHHIRDVTAT
jgi:hypothetical protein